MQDFYRQEKSVAGVNSVAHSNAVMAELLRRVFQGDDNWADIVRADWDEVSLEDAIATAYHGPDRKKKYVIKMV
ncbi:hypothetical protein CDD83_1167 [Cordyceps sp. RAO-2017]|nr:hypothetical protein CDD83_1167 [Cordyceps sp. RAO-2017]